MIESITCSHCGKKIYLEKDLVEAAQIYQKAVNNLEATFFDKISNVKNIKHKTELKEEYDKLVHYHNLAYRKINDLYSWFLAFGDDDDAAKNS